MTGSHQYPVHVNKCRDKSGSVHGSCGAGCGGPTNTPVESCLYVPRGPSHHHLSAGTFCPPTQCTLEYRRAPHFDTQAKLRNPKRERKLLFAPKRTTSYHRQRFEALQLVQAHTLLCESREPRSLPRLPFRGDIKPPPYRSRFRLVGSVQSLSRSFEQQPASIGQSATCLPP